ncbi:MAG: hypothetical protein A2504_13875 [Bdellovibrionales bacterium RIFOXYD12_FULL_39_22]|nr:MAG: hypothetical protein A2385_00600 [Bdellovibrionales bacterium RIFOXYB1_FULL_39_21]OFZ43823.1 MAG: hypothetical protein A2485_04930 [Bdellovibrionales bacterium RIFOXYC12_FULL_39_17]OFZ48843.1 MAG: hypothetical protein A2404_17915 [Bdellovibrionales bacterium RIFOXYC1_FULL_39_130]OFZ76576.1 MAG: hypothetical protein A2560_06580 [Bdellovibrionales bacterium RIFOXYD1_FULL_39_84]OFZ94810.1 MAG: hypothetical protein A2504_13875 [Bdellovibrionales bacterium RIFOXYD12_FULL_39_22]HLE12234.1 4F
MSTSRRDFIKILATLPLASSSFASDGHSEKNGDLASNGTSYSVLMDSTLCVGCRKCEWACNDKNHLPNKDISTFEDTSVFAFRRRPEVDKFTVVNKIQSLKEQQTIKIQCMHCLHPACASACIVGALKKQECGAVTYDADKCIGCRYCMVACPFQIPAYEYKNVLTPKVQKCSFCVDKLEKGEKPACVEMCPNEAMTFGTRAELIEVANSRMHQHPEKYFHHIYGEYEAGGTSWLYLSQIDLRGSEFPQLSSDPIPKLTETIQHGIFKNFVPPLALFTLLGVAMHSLKDKDRD